MASNFELIHYPTDDGSTGGHVVGAYGSLQEACTAAGYPDPRAWQGSPPASVILTADVIAAAGRASSPYLIQSCPTSSLNKED